MAGTSPLLFGLNFWTKRMALIHLGSERFATFWTRKGTSAMRHHNSVLHQILKHIPWSEFERVVEDHESDKHVRRLTTKSQLIAMLFAQLSGSVSLREIIAGLDSHQARLYRSRRHLCLRSRLLRLSLVGRVGSGGLPHRHAL